MRNVNKELGGWYKSFTKTELFLCVLQAVFLLVFVIFLIFLILHLYACFESKQQGSAVTGSVKITTDKTSEDDHVKDVIIENDNDCQNGNTPDVTEAIENISISTEGTIVTEYDYSQNITNEIEYIEGIEDNLSEEGRGTKAATQTNKQFTPLPKSRSEITCTWKPSQKTEVVAQYYEKGKMNEQTYLKLVTTKSGTQLKYQSSKHVFNEYLVNINDDNYENVYQSRFILALVKIKPQHDYRFGCTLTIVSQYWTLTAASCVETVGKLDSLDSFVMMDSFEGKNGTVHPISNVMIHPQYQGINYTYDLAVLKSEDPVASSNSLVLTIPTIVDYYLLTIGEKVSILGYSTLRSTVAFLLPTARCRRGAGRGRGRSAPLCAGAGRAPCARCAGAALVKEAVLLGVRSHGPHCGLTCEPALYVNLAQMKDWIDRVIYPI